MKKMTDEEIKQEAKCELNKNIDEMAYNVIKLANDDLVGNCTTEGQTDRIKHLIKLLNIQLLNTINKQDKYNKQLKLLTWIMGISAGFAILEYFGLNWDFILQMFKSK